MVMILVERDCVQCEELRLKKDLSNFHATQQSETRWQNPDKWTCGLILIYQLRTNRCKMSWRYYGPWPDYLNNATDSTDTCVYEPPSNERISHAEPHRSRLSWTHKVRNVAWFSKVFLYIGSVTKSLLAIGTCSLYTINRRLLYSSQQSK